MKRSGQRSNQGRLPNQRQMSNQWAHQPAVLNPMQMQLQDQGSTQMSSPMPMPLQMQMPNSWVNQVGMPGVAEYPVQAASQMLTYQPWQIHGQAQMQMQMDLQRQGYMQQMQQMQAEVPPLIPSTPEIQMPAPTRPAEASDIASIATQMLTPFPIQPATLASQMKSLGQERRQSNDEAMQE